MSSEPTWTNGEVLSLSRLQSRQITGLSEHIRTLEARLAAGDLVERAALALWAWCAEEAVLSPAGRQEQSRQEQSRLASLCWDAAVIFAEQSRGFAAGHEPKEN